MLTRGLAALYRAAGVLAGVFLVAICVIVCAQIVARQLDTIIPSADQFAGFCLAATSFLGLAWSFRGGSHIRVTLFTRALRGPAHRLMMMLALAIGSAITGLLAWHTVAMVIQNFARSEVTSGLVPVPIWLPQSGMAIGLVLFAVAMIEDLVRVILGYDPIFEDGEENPTENGEP
ncbi:TRAP-type C4-dicarboxylate transport system, small permease component [Jannaschia faecimaris]|uniref:TRAP transporter small permease protein n=1 Tax=Jannaschia faecimaris TaxID=1244108 RepID=A0A1H3UAD1_9RHOB|nr:TRAP-type C4-dicarboxylate transport system, small permease component [Jannaschia faecimaris]